MDIAPYVKPLNDAEVEAIEKVEPLSPGTYTITHTDSKTARAERRALRTALNLLDLEGSVRGLTEVTTKLTIAATIDDVVDVDA